MQSFTTPGFVRHTSNLIHSIDDLEEDYKCQIIVSSIRVIIRSYGHGHKTLSWLTKISDLTSKEKSDNIFKEKSNLNNLDCFRHYQGLNWKFLPLIVRSMNMIKLLPKFFGIVDAWVGELLHYFLAHNQF